MVNPITEKVEKIMKQIEKPDMQVNALEFYLKLKWEVDKFN